MVADREFTAEWVKQHVPKLLADSDLLAKYGDNAWQYGIRDAAEVMAKRVLSMMTKSRLRRWQVRSSHSKIPPMIGHMRDHG